MNKDVDIKAEVAVIKNDVKWIKEQITDFKKNFVTKSEFLPVRIIAYGVAGAAGFALIQALLNLVIQ